jgi:hypothetical protein
MRETKRQKFLTEGNEGNEGGRRRLKLEFECEWRGGGQTFPLVLRVGS